MVSQPYGVRTVSPPAPGEPDHLPGRGMRENDLVGTGGTLDKGCLPPRTFVPPDPEPVRTAVPLSVWTKRRHVDLCRTHASLCR